jgi:large subunit ribosomal protein L22
MKKATAKLKNVRIAPRKMRSVCGVIRGLEVQHALAQLQVITARSAEPVAKLLNSAVANAKNANLNESCLFIETIVVNEGPVMKRYRARARGSANLIQKKLSHVTVVLAEKEGGAQPKAVSVPATKQADTKEKKGSVAKKVKTAPKTEKKEEKTVAKKDKTTAKKTAKTTAKKKA